MKKLLPRIFLIAQLILVPFIISDVLADPPGPPLPGGNPVSGGGTPVGAPIDDGIVVLLALGIAYGSYKIYVIKRNEITLNKEEPV
jgi:hypothetical protein